MEKKTFVKEPCGCENEKRLTPKAGFRPVLLKSHQCELPFGIRRDEATLTMQQKNDFNQVISQLIADGSYQELVDIHGEMPMMYMHAMQNFSSDGAVRFLPWHRVYLYELEKLIAQYDPTIKIPYWNWIENPRIPEWVDQQNAIRDFQESGMPSGNLCSPFGHKKYRRFNESLESFHNSVHTAVGETMSDPTISPSDPIFWLHHAFVDKIWFDWQHIYPNTFDEVSGSNYLNPWLVTIEEAQDIEGFCTSYQGFVNCLSEVSGKHSRKFIDSLSCQEIEALSNTHIAHLIENLLSGITSNKDERAVIKVFECIDCERGAQIVESVGLENIQKKFQGKERVRLEIMFGECGVLSMADWDDTVTMEYLDQISCTQLKSLSNSQIRDLINNLLSGSTFNKEEKAIINIFKCLDCDRVRSVAIMVGTQKLLKKFQGPEERTLMLRLGTCGAISFANWSDDASRHFVNTNTCHHLNQLSNIQIRDLINNMLTGWTGNKDEKSILRLIGCLDCTRRATIVRMVGKDDILKKFQGDEKKKLKTMFKDCEI